jgi:hypothetical protein
MDSRCLLLLCLVHCVCWLSPFEFVFVRTKYQVSPGTVVFHDVRSQEENPSLDLVPAALLLSRVVSLPNPNTVTCDAGTVSM